MFGRNLQEKKSSKQTVINLQWTYTDARWQLSGANYFSTNDVNMQPTRPL
jgi:hypothetical protein